MDYERDYFWIKVDALGLKHYYFKTENGLLEVNKQVYMVCFCSYLKMRRDFRKDAGKLISYDYINNDGHTLMDLIGKNIDYKKEIIFNTLFAKIKNLTLEEQLIVQALFFDGYSLRELSNLTGIAVSSLEQFAVGMLRPKVYMNERTFCVLRNYRM